MKAFKAMLVTCFLMASNGMAANNWSNCMGAPQTEPIQSVFWKSDVDGGGGPEYTLKSGQIFINAGSLCRAGQILKENEWIKELKSGLNPANSVSTFREVRNAEDFQKFLQENQIAVDDEKNLTEAVQAFLAGKPIHPMILVGASKKEVVILLASSDGKKQNATLMQMKLAAGRQ